MTRVSPYVNPIDDSPLKWIKDFEKYTGKKWAEESPEEKPEELPEDTTTEQQLDSDLENSPENEDVQQQK